MFACMVVLLQGSEVAVGAAFVHGLSYIYSACGKRCKVNVVECCPCICQVLPA